MNINNYRKAMDQIIPDHALKERIMSQKTSQKRYIPVRRILTGALAAVLALACLFTAALAASPELRTAVLSFFHMEEREQVPGKEPGAEQTGPGVSQAEIGALVKAQYIRMDGYNYQYSGGGLLKSLTWSEDGRTLLDAKFWEVKDNEVLPVKVDLHTCQLGVTYGGVRYQGELYWYVRNGELCAFRGSPIGVAARPEDQWYVTASLRGRTDALLLHVFQGGQMERTESILLYHLETGETEDLLADLDPAVMEQSDGTIWSPNARRVLITGRAGPEFPRGREWLYDRESGTLENVSSLGGTGADMAVFLNDNTLLLRVYTEDAENVPVTIAFWVYDIPSGQAVQTLEPSPYFRQQDEAPYGIMPFYGDSCMEIGQDGSVCLIDLITGVRTKLENFTYQKGMEFTPSPSGDKVLYFAMDSEADGLGITQLGVIDLEKGAFFAFDREGYRNLHEESIGWEDDCTVSLGATSSDGEARYIILYQF